jgi:FkbM family methyltransferase
MIKKQIATFLKTYFPSVMFSHKYFAQDGEDVILNAYYKYKKRNHKGFYIDVGAHHPFRFSNTALFYKKGWRGINIEPTPHLFDAFLKYRKNDINLNIAISDTNDTLTFFEFNESALNSFDEKLSLERESNPSYKIINRRQIQVYKLADILEKYLPANQEIDFLTIDVEGYDMNILHSNNWVKYKPKFILIEADLDFNHLNENEIYRFLTGENYQLTAKAKRTLLFKLEDL